MHGKLGELFKWHASVHSYAVCVPFGMQVCTIVLYMYLDCMYHCRAALRCADAVSKDSIGSLFEAKARLVSPELRAIVLARGEPKRAAETQALGGRLPTKMLSWLRPLTWLLLAARPPATSPAGRAADVLQGAAARVRMPVQHPSHSKLHRQLLQQEHSPQH